MQLHIVTLVICCYIITINCDQAWENRSYLCQIHLFVLWHLSSVSVCAIYNLFFLLKFLMDSCIYIDILDTIWITDKKLLHFKLSKLGQILQVDKIGFPGPVTIIDVIN